MRMVLLLCKLHCIIELSNLFGHILNQNTSERGFDMKKCIPVIFCLLIMTAFTCSAVFLTNQDFAAVVSDNSLSAVLPVIIVDAGHGGFDGGAKSIDGQQEKDFNLAIALKLADKLRADGFAVIMTRTEDAGTENDGLGTLREKKVSDIRNRMKLMQETENCIFVSIHQNFFSDQSCRGAQVFYSGNDPSSKILASCIQKSIAASIQPDNTRVTKKSDSSVYLMYHAEKCAVLVECGFISNYQEVQNLSDDTYQKQLVFAISEGIYNYIFNTSEAPNGVEN